MTATGTRFVTNSTTTAPSTMKVIVLSAIAGSLQASFTLVRCGSVSEGAWGELGCQPDVVRQRIEALRKREAYLVFLGRSSTSRSMVSSIPT